MVENPRQIHLNAFLRNVGQHEAAWRLPETDTNAVTDIGHYQRLAQIAEKGKLDAIFFADHPALKDRSEDRPWDPLDPFTLITALSGVTSRIGLVATGSTTYNDPYGIARRFATLDHVSRGRAAWNVVTTASASAAENFGFDQHPDPDARYARAAEFLDVAFALWDSWDDDAIVGDKAGGVFVDRDKIHRIDHVGPHFRVAGPLEIPRSPQGRPVIFQAGSSEPGKDLAARYADAIFTAQPTIEEGQAFYADIKGRVRAVGRDPHTVLILPGLSFFIGGTEAEAFALREQFEDLTLPTYGIAPALPRHRPRPQRLRPRQPDPDPAAAGARRQPAQPPRPGAPPHQHGESDASPVAAPPQRRARSSHRHRDAGADRRDHRRMVRERRRRRLQPHPAGIADVARQLRRAGHPAAAAARPVPHRL